MADRSVQVIGEGKRERLAPLPKEIG